MRASREVSWKDCETRGVRARASSVNASHQGDGKRTGDDAENHEQEFLKKVLTGWQTGIRQCGSGLFL